MKYLDRYKILFKPLANRVNKVDIVRDIVMPSQKSNISNQNLDTIKTIADDIKKARANGKPVILAFGAHAIKNALASIMIELIKNNFVTHLATNGAGIIHDWEFAYMGQSSEDVRTNISKGEFGIWQETCYYLNLAILVGAQSGLGYGESVGRLIYEQGLHIKSLSELKRVALENMEHNASVSAQALDLMDKIQKFNLKEGFLSIEHKYKSYSVQAEAYRLGIPFTAHPMFGHDIIYSHPMSTGAAIGRSAERDFLSFANAVSELDGGVYLSLGSAVMSPMIFEKSLSMARNIAMQSQNEIDNFSIYVVDLAESSWDWSQGEPDTQNPAYYQRYMKTFSRMVGNVKYISANNADFLLAMHSTLLL